MDELLGAIRIIVQAKLANAMGCIDLQHPPPSNALEAPVTAAGTCKGTSVGDNS